MRVRYGNFLNEAHGLDCWYYQQVVRPPFPGVDAHRIAQVVQAAIPGLRVVHQPEVDGGWEVNGFLETIGPFTAPDDPLPFFHVTLVNYDFECLSPACPLHQADVPCLDPTCPESGTSATEFYLQAVNSRPDLFSMEEQTALARALGPTTSLPAPRSDGQVGAITPREHSHKRLVGFRPVGLLSPQQLERVETLLPPHPQLELTMDEGRNRQVYAALGVADDPRYEALMAPSKHYSHPSAQHLLPPAVEDRPEPRPRNVRSSLLWTPRGGG